jgi:hypothetical protein
MVIYVKYLMLCLVYTPLMAPLLVTRTKYGKRCFSHTGPAVWQMMCTTFICFQKDAGAVQTSCTTKAAMYFNVGVF